MIVHREGFGEEEDMPVPDLLAGAAPASPCHHLPLQLPGHLAPVSAAHKQETDSKITGRSYLAKHVGLEHMTKASLREADVHSC